jgi:hypothetical protein
VIVTPTHPEVNTKELVYHAPMDMEDVGINVYDYGETESVQNLRKSALRSWLFKKTRFFFCDPKGGR